MSKSYSFEASINNLFIITKNFRGLLFFKISYRMLLDGIAAWRFLFRGEVDNFI
ncbi:MAG: hypothetical protein ACI8RY_001797, partial [Urechidicola sp.]